MGPHDESWWDSPEHPERQNLLYDVLWERMIEDSEDGKGNQVYIKERCHRYKQYVADLERQKAQDEKRRERLMKENQRNKELGRPQINIPAPLKVDKREYKSKLRHFEALFNKEQYDKKEQEIIKAGYGNESLASQVGGHDPNHPCMWQ